MTSRPSTGVFAFAMAFAVLAAGAPPRAHAASAEKILDATGVRGGLAVLVGCKDGRLAADLARRDGFLVQALTGKADHLAAARRHLAAAGVYGKASAMPHAGDRLPYADGLVNLLILDEGASVPESEALRVLAPGGAAYRLGAKAAQAKTVKPRPSEIDEWTHHLHGPGGNAVAADRKVGPPRRLQWTAGPMWARSHGYTPSVTAMVSSGGRVFAICDETLACIDDTVPSKWRLVARDAFSGVLLWKRPMGPWGSAALSGTADTGRGVTTGRFTMPQHAAKRLVAMGDVVYVTPGAEAPVTALDAATGKVRRVYKDTERTDEILCTGKRLVLAVNPPAEKRPPVVDRKSTPPPPPAKEVCVVDAASGEVLWRRGGFVGVRAMLGQDPFGRLELAAGDGRIVALTHDAIECMAMEDGKTLWRIDRPKLPDDAVRKLGFAGVFEFRLAVMVYHDGVVLLAQPQPNTHHTYHTMPGTVYAFDAESGKAMWEHAYGGWGHCTQPDLFVVGDVVWTHVDAETEYGHCWGGGYRAKNSSKVDYRIQALDLRTGKARKELGTRTVFDVGHHHRCYRNRITERFLLASRRGVEFVDLATGENTQNHWVRSGCLLGNLPCNGLLYVTPHPCGCYLNAKLTGFNALAPAAASEAPRTPDDKRLTKGPAYEKVELPGQADATAKDAWPTYRHDGRRTAATDADVSAELAVAWQADVGGSATAVTVANGRILCAAADEHTVCAFDAAGKRRWCYTADARVDSPPTIHGPVAVFGSADGCVTCLRIEDGEMVWQFDAAPRREFIVSYGRLESRWPVHGSVLVREGKCWFAAGRSSYIDGGMRLYALDLASGEVAQRETICHVDPKTGKMAAETNAHGMAGALNDIAATDGRAVFLRGEKVAGGKGRGGPRVYMTGGYLDSNWFNRTYWRAGQQAQTSGPMALGEEVAYGMEVFGSRSRDSVFKPGAGNYRLRCMPLAIDRKGKAKAKRRRRRGPVCVWEKKVPARAVAVIRAGDVVFAAGSPDVVDPDDPHAAWEGRKGGLLMAFAAEDGEKLGELKLPAPATWDGVAAAGGRLYVAMTNGKIACLAPADAVAAVKSSRR